MKKIKTIVLATILLPLTFTLNATADPLLPGQVDFGTFSPTGSGEFVEVNVPSSLISLAVRFVEKQEPDVAKLLNGIKLVRVNVIGLTDDNRTEIEGRIKRVRNSLSGSGWEKIVTAQKDNNDVGVYLKMDAQSAIQGLALTVLEGTKHAVFVNVVGDIRPEQLSMLGEKLNIQPLKDMGLSEKPEHAAEDESIK